MNAASVYQFYNLDRLWSDIATAPDAGLKVVNFATEPVSVCDVIRAAFDRDFTNDPGTPPAHFDMRQNTPRCSRGTTATSTTAPTCWANCGRS